MRNCFNLPLELISVIKNAVQQGGVLSLWQGLGPTLLRDVPFSGNYFETVQRHFVPAWAGTAFTLCSQYHVTNDINVFLTLHSVNCCQQYFYNNNKLLLVLTCVTFGFCHLFFSLLLESCYFQVVKIMC